MNTLPDFDTLLTFTPQELTDLLNTEAYTVINAAPKENQERLKAVFNGCKLRSQAAKTPEAAMIAASDAMHDSFEVLNDKMQEFVGNKTLHK